MTDLTQAKEEIRADFFKECEANKAATANAYAEIVVHMVLQERQKLDYQMRTLLREITEVAQKGMIR
jgi:transcription termination factor NusB